MLTFKKIVVLACIGIGSASLGQLSFADENTEIKPLALRKIMQELGKNMQVVTDGISREDWELVARIAPLIADHPQPPAIEKVRILKFIGSDVVVESKFVDIVRLNLSTRGIFHQFHQ